MTKCESAAKAGRDVISWTSSRTSTEHSARASRSSKIRSSTTVSEQWRSWRSSITSVGPERMGDQLAEPPGCVVTRVEREPGAAARPAVIREPIGQQRRLAGAGEPGNEHRFPRADAGAPIVQARPPVPRCRKARHSSLRTYGKYCDRHFNPTVEHAQQERLRQSHLRAQKGETTSPPGVNSPPRGESLRALCTRSCWCRRAGASSLLREVIAQARFLFTRSSSVWTSFGFSPTNAARTLSCTASEVMTNSAEVPGWTSLRTESMKSSSIPTSAIDPLTPPSAAPTAMPKSGTKNSSPNSNPQNEPESAPTPARLCNCLVFGRFLPAGQLSHGSRHRGP